MNSRLFVTAALAALVFVSRPGAQGAGDTATLADFDARVQAYLAVRERASMTTPALTTLPDPGEIRRRTDALAAAIVTLRHGARQGDIFTPAIAIHIRRAVRQECDPDYADLLAIVQDDLDFPLVAAVVHGRWPMGAPLPTMTPDILAALPRLPPGLEYRFLRGDLVLRDIDANLILDFVPDVIPLAGRS